MQIRYLAIFLIAIIGLHQYNAQFGGPLFTVMATLAYLKYAIFGGKNPIFSPIFLDSEGAVACVRADSPEESQRLSQLYAAIDLVLKSDNVEDFNKNIEQFIPIFNENLQKSGKKLSDCVTKNPTYAKIAGEAMNIIQKQKELLKNAAKNAGESLKNAGAKAEAFASKLKDKIFDLFKPLN
jgi:hypothetical protein